jgi:hypothetical protein
MDFEKRTKTLRLRGDIEKWFGRCCYALEKAKFKLVRDDRRSGTIEARYKGFTIEGNLSLTLTDNAGMVELRIVVSADTGNLFAMFKDPCERIMYAFTSYLRD